MMNFENINIDSYLEKHGSWNPKRTVARLSIFETPLSLLHPNTAAPTEAVLDNEVDLRLCPAVGGLTCNACIMTFVNVGEQRSHFKSVLHNTNLRRRLQGLAVLDASSIDTDESNGREAITAEADNESGDSGDDAAANDNADDFEGLELKDLRPVSGILPEGEYSRTVSGTYGPVLTFRPVHHPNWEFSCSEILLKTPEVVNPKDAVQINPWSTLLSGFNFLRENSRIWCILILRSGKFAGAVFDGETVLAHKVFRRYTIRAKSGGSQSSYDNAHGKAASAGAMMRRQGEVMLKEDVADLLRSWQAHLQTCFTILVSCPKTMKNVLFDDNVREAVLRKDDLRIRSVPFMVSTPTFEEVLRVRDRCSVVIFRRYASQSLISTATDITVADEEFCKDLPSADVASYNIVSSVLSASSSSSSSPTPYVAVASEFSAEADVKPADEAEAVLISELYELPDCKLNRRLFEAIDIGDTEGISRLILEINRLVFVREVLTGESADSLRDMTIDCTGLEDIEDWELGDIVNMPANVETMDTPLHRAATQGVSGAVSILLENSADPCRIDVRGRVPYMVSKDKATRDAFRRARAADENAYNWSAAGVPTALTSEMEKAQREKEKEKKKKAKAKKKDQKTREDGTKEAQLVDEEAEEAQRHNLEEQRRQQELTSAGICASCGSSLLNVPFLCVMGYRCCSNTCVIRFKRKLAADAALERIQQKKNVGN
jgi:hypothetical protein